MSKLIVEMELPCKIYYLGGLHGTPTCPIERRICKDQKNPPSWCPIKGVLPEEHGDLVDRDELIIELMNRGIEGIQTDDLAEFQQIVMDAKAVIAAERKDDGK